MSTGRFTKLAAKLYPITVPSESQEIQAIASLGDRKSGAGPVLFDGLARSPQGQLVVCHKQPRTEDEFRTVRGEHALVHSDIVERYELPVRAFIRVARRMGASYERHLARLTALNQRQGWGLEVPKIDPVYRDGLLALAQELERRKANRSANRSYVNTGCTSVEM